MSDAEKTMPVYKTMSVSPDEESLLEFYRQHLNEDITIWHDPLDIRHKNLYIVFDEKEKKYKEMEDKDFLAWREAERFLAAIIAAHDGVPVEDVTPEYSKRTLRESQERFQREIREKEYADPKETAKRFIRQAALDLA